MLILSEVIFEYIPTARSTINKLLHTRQIGMMILSLYGSPNLTLLVSLFY
jgi:hypothetical protein